MFKILFLTTLLIALSIQQKDRQSKFDEALGVFIKKINGTKLPRNENVDRTKCKSNMRRTNEFAKQLHDIFTFVNSYSDNETHSKRDTLVGYTINSTYCPYQNQKIVCSSSSKYRTYDGTCNNLLNPIVGAANTPYLRMAPPAYDDGFNSPRTLAVSGNKLPNPRNISLTVSFPTSTQRLVKNELAQLYATFGQFLIHDMGAASATTDSTGTELDCPCGSTDPNCISFSVPPNDQFLGFECQNTGNANVGQANLECITNGVSKQTCIKVARSSATFPDFSCQNSYREQLNLYSAFIDGTAIYGADQTRASQLRAFSGGLLKTSPGISGSTSYVPGESLTARSYLPLSNDTCSTSTSAGYKCFLAGEHRTSENLALVGMQTLFNREHNRVAAQLALVNPQWNDETLYQEARRIVVAEMQHITFNEFVGELIGDTSLKPLATNTYFNGYNASVSPQLFDEFSSAAFRMGHSLMRQILGRSNINQTYKEFVNAYFPSYFFQDSVFQSDMAYNQKTEGLNSIFLALLNDIAWKFGSFGTALQSNLQKTTDSNGNTYAVDLLALNIARGRDHGLQPYVKYIKQCFNVTINTFDDLAPQFMNAFNVNELKTLYENVNDIDLYTGGLQERIVNDPAYIVGPTFGCIIMKQFQNIKISDRFYYENGPGVNPYPFTLDQLAQIKNVTMAGLICNNYDIFKIQTRAFYTHFAANNPVVDCKTFLNQINFSKWAA